MFEIFSEKVVAVNSSLGMETYFAGATLDLPKIRLNKMHFFKAIHHS